MNKKSNKQDLIGQRYFYLTVIELYKVHGHGNTWKVKCDCGKVIIVLTSRFRKNKSCGCNRKKLIEKAITKHGLWSHPLYGTWNSIKQRCTNPKNRAYKNYGGRGIKICDRWMDVGKFIIDMYPTHKEGLSIDRLDNNGDYTLENCRWATREQQNNNTRQNKIINTQKGKMNIKQASRIFDIKYTTLISRVYRGWQEEKLLTPPRPFFPQGLNCKTNSTKE